MASEQVSDRDSDACGCCQPLVTPAVYNAPGAPSLRYRVDTHSSALAGMLAQLSRLTLAGSFQPALARLTTRAASDPAIAVLDAWAIVVDILTFYQERIANEGFLGTSQERRSIHELAAMIGYQLKPGVAASAMLAFTIDAPVVVPAMTPGATPPHAMMSPAIVPIAIGTKVQSTPGPGELPQTFETVEAIEARVAWNAIRPLRARRQQLAISAGKVCFRRDDGSEPAVAQLWLDTTSANLSPGDWLVVEVDNGHREPSDPVSMQVSQGLAPVRVRKVEVDQSNGRTRVRLLQGNTSPVPSFALPARPQGTIATDALTLDAATVRARILDKRWSEPALAALIAAQRWDEGRVLAQVNALIAQSPAPATVSVLRQTAAAFGALAPAYASLPQAVRGRYSNWDASSLSVWQRSNGALRETADLYLDRVVEGLAPGGFVLLTGANNAPALFVIRAVTERSLSDFAITGKATGLQLSDLDGSDLSASFKSNAGNVWKLRSTTVRVLSQSLPVGEVPLPDTIAGPAVDHFITERMVLGLRAGQAIAVSGIAHDAAGAALGFRTELARLHTIAHQAGRSVLELEAPLANTYERASFALCANLTRATHGETVLDEQLGSGDGSAHQARVLKRPPLTRVSAPTASGTLSTLDVRVDGVSWQQVPTLLDAGAGDRVYQVRTDDAGKSTIIFGDGEHGVRPSTGRDNIAASYRTGMGIAGEVAAGKLTLLASRPLGLRGVVNPEAASGAEDPEPLGVARSHAPRTVRTLDRIVSLTDFEDFARGFAGIAKARAVEVWDGHGRLVHLSVAGFAGAPVAQGSELQRNLLRAIHDLGDGIERVVVASFSSAQLALEATLLIHRDHQPEQVLSTATALASAAYAFEARELAQPVTEAEVVTQLSAVAGVAAVKVTRLHRLDRALATEPVIVASDARWNAVSAQVEPAELLTLLPVNLRLTAVSP